MTKLVDKQYICLKIKKLKSVGLPTAYASFVFVLRKAQNKDSGRPAPLLLKGCEKMENRTKILNFRVTEDEKQKIESLANTKYDSLAPYLRDCALQKDITVIPGIVGVEDKLRRIGNNLNQLTRAVNSGICMAVDLSEMRTEVAKIWQLLSSLLER